MSETEKKAYERLIQTYENALADSTKRTASLTEAIKKGGTLEEIITAAHAFYAFISAAPAPEKRGTLH